MVGVDWRVPLDAAWERVGSDVGASRATSTRPRCSAPWDVVEAKALDVLRAGRTDARARVQPGARRAAGTPTPRRCERLVDLVHERPNDRRRRR